MHGYVNGYLQAQSTARPLSTLRPNYEVKVQYLPTDVSSRFGLRLRELRRAHNMTQLRMAVDFGIDRSYISEIERGRKSVSLPTLEIIALGLHLSLSDLLDGI